MATKADKVIDYDLEIEKIREKKKKKFKFKLGGQEFETIEFISTSMYLDLFTDVTGATAEETLTTIVSLVQSGQRDDLRELLTDSEGNIPVQILTKMTEDITSFLATDQ